MTLMEGRGTLGGGGRQFVAMISFSGTGKPKVAVSQKVISH